MFIIPDDDFSSTTLCDGAGADPSDGSKVSNLTIGTKSCDIPASPVEGDGSTCHRFEPAGSRDSRSSCPALNALANHSYVNHEGRNISIVDLAAAIRKVFHTSIPLSSKLAMSILKRKGCKVDLHEITRDIGQGPQVWHAGFTPERDTSPVQSTAPFQPMFPYLEKSGEAEVGMREILLAMDAHARDRQLAVRMDVIRAATPGSALGSIYRLARMKADLEVRERLSKDPISAFRREFKVADRGMNYDMLREGQEEALYWGILHLRLEMWHMFMGAFGGIEEEPKVSMEVMKDFLIEGKLPEGWKRPTHSAGVLNTKIGTALARSKLHSLVSLKNLTVFDVSVRSTELWARMS